MKTGLLISFLSWASMMVGQAPLSIAATHYGLDSGGRTMLVQAGAASLRAAANGLVTPDDRYRFSEEPSALVYDSSYVVTSRNGDSFLVAFTPLPLVKITTSRSLNQYEKRPAVLTYADGEEVVVSDIGVRYRGNFSLQYPKKSLDLAFYESAGNTRSRDVRFGDMRSDDDWVIDALYNEPSRVNAYVAHKLWLDLHRLRYAAEEPQARAGADVAFVELWFNGTYWGLCTIGEQVDRKLLQLKKSRDDEARGVLFKGVDYSNATTFTSVPTEVVKGNTWAGWEVKHPEPDEVNWEELREFVRFSASSSHDEFVAEAEYRIDVANVVDYVLFVNALSLADNVAKNTYLARYNHSTPFFFIPWDLDAGMGNDYRGERYTSFDHFSENKLFRRLRERNAGNYTEKLCARYQLLREGLLDPDSLVARVTTAMTTLRESGAYRREAERWPGTVMSDAEQLNFMASVLKARIDKLDDYVCSLPTGTVAAEQSSASSLRVFPNPARRAVTVRLPVAAERTEYVLYGSAGQPLRSGYLHGGQAEVSVRGLAAGMYYFRVGRQVARLTVVH